MDIVDKVVCEGAVIGAPVDGLYADAVRRRPDITEHIPTAFLNDHVVMEASLAVFFRAPVRIHEYHAWIAVMLCLERSAQGAAELLPVFLQGCVVGREMFVIVFQSDEDPSLFKIRVQYTGELLCVHFSWVRSFALTWRSN